MTSPPSNQGRPFKRSATNVGLVLEVLKEGAVDLALHLHLKLLGGVQKTKMAAAPAFLKPHLLHTYHRSKKKKSRAWISHQHHLELFDHYPTSGTALSITLLWVHISHQPSLIHCRLKHSTRFCCLWGLKAGLNCIRLDWVELH